MFLNACAFFILVVHAQTYCPMLKDGKVWDYYYTNSFFEGNLSYQIDGDSIVDGQKCYKLYWTFTDQWTGNVMAAHGYQGMLYEKDKRVYYISVNGAHSLLYDFGLSAGDSLHNRVVSSVDAVYVGGQMRRRLRLTENNEMGMTATAYLVEGVGCSRGMLDTGGGGDALIACYEDGKCIFTGKNFTDMPSHPVAPETALLLTEGKRWWYSEPYAKLEQRPERTYLYVQGDTLLSGISWKKVYRYADGPVYEKSMRESDGKIYELHDGETGLGKLLFDYTLKVGERFTPENKSDRYMEVVAIDTMQSQGIARRRLILLQHVGGVPTDLTSWTEGIGSDVGIDVSAVWSDQQLPEQDVNSHYKYLFLGCTDGGRCIYGDDSFLDRIEAVEQKPATSDVLYDLQGRRVTDSTAKGLIIGNGRKRLKR